MNAAINRAVAVEIDGEPFEMLLTVRATAEIEQKLGGLENAVEKLDGDDKIASVETAAELVAILCNGGTERYNYRHKDAPRRMLTQEEVMMLTTPGEMTVLLHEAVKAIRAGKETYVKSEESPGESKN